MRIKKVLLINPPFVYFPGIASRITNYFRIPLGLCYLASYIREKHNLQVEIIDASALGWNLKEIGEKIIGFNPDLIGISVATPNVSISCELISLAKRIRKEIPVVVGGPHVSAIPTDLLHIADIAVIGEGEETFSELIHCLIQGTPVSAINGIAFRRNGDITITPKRKLIDNLDLIPFPALDLLDISKYKHIYPYKNNNNKVASIITSRGCPYDCYFCGNNYLWGGRVRYRSIANVINEIEYFKIKLDVSLFWLEDDLFGTEPRIKEFCHRLIELNLNIRWLCHMRCNGISDEALFIMKKAGCLEIQIGVESGNDAVLREANKHLTVAEIRAFFKKIHSIGINTWATFIFGLYGENMKTINESIKLAKEIDPTYATFIHLLPFPGTRIYKDYSERGYIRTYNWSKYSWHSLPVFETEYLKYHDLIKLKKRAYILFYLRPNKLFSYGMQLFKTGQLKLMLKNFVLLIKLGLNK